MNRRKFLKIFGVAMTSAGISGCVATFNSKETKFEPNPIPQEKKHFERNIFRSAQDALEHHKKHGLKDGDVLITEYMTLDFHGWGKYKG